MSQFGNLSCTRGAEVTLSAASTTTSAPFMGQVPFCPTTGICQRHLWQSCLSSFLPFSVCFSSLNIIHSSPSRYLELYLKVMFEVGIQNRGTDVEKLVVLFVFYWLSDWQCCFVCPTECQEPSEQQGFKDPVGQRWLFNHHWLWFGEITFIYIYTLFSGFCKTIQLCHQRVTLSKLKKKSQLAFCININTASKDW